MRCPKCQSHNVARPHARGYERFIRLFLFRKYYRCQKCQNRFSRMALELSPDLITIYIIYLLFVLAVVALLK